MRVIFGFWILLNRILIGIGLVVLTAAVAMGTMLAKTVVSSVVECGRSDEENRKGRL